MAGIQLVEDASVEKPFPWEDQTGARVCVAARTYGLLTRPIRDTLVLMPPLVITEDELRLAVRALSLAITDICGKD
jgi:adenosylmethionine-8-amino-7-oxononanoate aminotransferase